MYYTYTAYNCEQQCCTCMDLQLIADRIARRSAHFEAQLVSTDGRHSLPNWRPLCGLVLPPQPVVQRRDVLHMYR